MVVLKLEVGADGAVDAAVVQATTSGVSRPMASAAVEAAQQWRFAPELVAGQAVPSTMLWPVCYVGRETSLRSEEHTSELQSLMRISYAVFCLKKKKTVRTYKYNIIS